MPTTRRSTSGSKSGAGGKQATLSFHNRVTKSVPKSSKDLVTSTTPTKASPLSKQVSPPAEDVEIEEPEETTSEVIEEAPAKSQAELRAEKIKHKQIGDYWKKIEKERLSKRVHQNELTLEEKVLRYFDVSNQYGVSTCPLPVVKLPRQCSDLLHNMKSVGFADEIIQT
jgi:DNA polymerase delta subunit 4